MTYAINTASYYVDNALAVVLYKGGWLFAFMYFLPIIRVICLNLFISRKYKDSLYLLTSLVLAMLIISTMLMTSQAIHTYAINVFVWTLVGITSKNFKGSV